MARVPSKVVPWGRSLDEYVRMFSLSSADLGSRILDCGAGPSSFNAEVTSGGGHVVSCDPIYEFSVGEIRQRVHETYPEMVAGAKAHREKFVWQEHESPERLGKIRMAAMKKFFADYPNGFREGRYHVAELPTLSFPDAEFDLALCSHFLFTYSDLFSLEFHIQSVRELCRVASETRVFPLLPNFASRHSVHLAPLVCQLSTDGYRCEIVRVAYEFQKGGNELLRIVRNRP